MTDGQRRRYFHLGHEVMCAAGGVVAGAVLAWWIKPSVIVSMEPADFGFDDDDDDFSGDGDCSSSDVCSSAASTGSTGGSTASSTGSGERTGELDPSPSGERTSELVREEERAVFENRRSKEIAELAKLREKRERA